MPKKPAHSLVSVVIPCYDSARFLDEAVDSVLASTYPAVEVVVVDDGSRDPETRRVLEGFARPRTRVCRIEHCGPSGARNFGIRQAQGSYILPLDDDDRIHPQYIAKAAKVLTHDPAVGIVYCRARCFGARQDEWRLPPYSLENMLADNCIFTSALFRKRDWERVGGYNPNMVHGMEDYDFWLSLIERAGAEVVQLDQVLFYYRVQDVSRTVLMEVNGHEAEMFTTLFYNHRELFLRGRNMRHLFGKRVQLVRELRKLEHLVNQSPVLKVEKRLNRFPRLRWLYYRFYDLLIWVLHRLRWMRRSRAR